MMKHFSKLKILIFAADVIIAVNLPNKSTAQTVNHFSGWAAIFGNAKLSNRFSLHFEGQLRSNNEWKEVQTFILRTGLIYRVNATQTATIGYAFIGHHRNIDSISGWGPEHRIWEQYIFNMGFDLSEHFVSLQNRFRLEQRFVSASVVNGDKLETDHYNFSQRIRYFIRGIFPLSRTPDRKFLNGPFVSLQNEIFFNITNASNVNDKFFDQNRAYMSIGYRFSPKYDAEIGYMYQFIAGRGDRKTNNNILQLATYLRL